MTTWWKWREKGPMICWFSYCCCTLNRPNETREIMDVIQKCPKKCLNKQMRTQVWLSGCALTPHITSWDVGESTVRLLNLKTRKICHVSRCSSQLGPIVAECRLCSGTRWPTVSWVWHIHCTAAKLSQWQVASSVTKAGFSKFLFFFFLCNIHLLRNKQFVLSGWLLVMNIYAIEKYVAF